MMASFHVPEQGDAYAGARMPDVPASETVALTYNEFSRLNGEGPDWDGESRPMDIRYINAPTAPPGEPHGRGLAQGRFFDRSGRLVASCAQEGMIRWA